MPPEADDKTTSATETQTTESRSEKLFENKETAEETKATTEETTKGADTDETKTGDETKTEEKTDDKKTDETKTTDEPITFDSLKVPEGFDKEDPLAGEFLALVNDAEISPTDRANKFIDIYARAVDQFNAAAEKMWLDQNAEWQSQLSKQYGGDKGLEAKLSKVGTLIDAYDKDQREAHQGSDPAPEFSKDLRQQMTLTGAGNNPAVMNFLFWVADQLGEGSPLSGAPPAQDRTRAEKLFGT